LVCGSDDQLFAVVMPYLYLRLGFDKTIVLPLHGVIASKSNINPERVISPRIIALIIMIILSYSFENKQIEPVETARLEPIISSLYKNIHSMQDCLS
jgi:hypothetical protein